LDRIWETGKRKLALDVTIKCEGVCRFRVVASDKDNKKTNYADRTIEVNGYRTIYLSFPVSPDQTRITVTPLDNTKDFLVDIKEKNLKTYQIHLDNEASKFVKFAQEFTQVSGYSQGSPQGRFFRTKDGYFNIRYYPIIQDKGKPSTTPARIGHRSGIIDVSKFHFDRYTIPMRMCILLHEFSHKYRNPKIDLEISNEVGADLNALYIYLGMGYSKVDAIFVFANVFLKAQSQGNMVRMRKIMDYIKRFENEEFAKILTQ
jgi:hypothetical protein